MTGRSLPPCPLRSGYAGERLKALVRGPRRAWVARGVRASPASPMNAFKGPAALCVFEGRERRCGATATAGPGCPESQQRPDFCLAVCAKTHSRSLRSFSMLCNHAAQRSDFDRKDHLNLSAISEPDSLERLQMGDVDALARAILAGHGRQIEELFDVAGLEHPQIVVRPRAEQVPEGVLRSLYRYWQALRVDGACPAASAIDPLAMRFALGHVVLLDSLDGGADFRVRLYGTMIADRLGHDLTGQRLSQLKGLAIMPFFTATYRCAMLERCAVLTRHASPPDIPVAWWERLILPLADSAGDIIRLLVGMVGGPSRTAYPTGFLAPLAR